ncbi:MAG TPA: hypothetical protein VGP72_07680 [Planctomycetota bacterium]|jgi:hypothetical protein
MRIEQSIARLEKEWEPDHGFFFILNDGVFDEEGLRRVTEVLEAIEYQPKGSINSRFVEVTWRMPLKLQQLATFMLENGEDHQRLVEAAKQIDELLERILGRA